MYFSRSKSISFFRRSPHGLRGLKYTTFRTNQKPSESQPAWAAWIEIIEDPVKIFFAEGRSPHGLRGLKFRRFQMCLGGSCRSPHGLRGLKLFSNFKQFLFNFCRSPHGLRGLKSFPQRSFSSAAAVAARMGCVD